ncbi:hypothetical protein O0I10_004884 [Lichtheimia ornata]|uniref:Uncharacterized protein n=1 Tax=Lichtheimia ornata TaxID=688661 RepID=A0AAD7V5W7_9FUNG|nr:uncharacterized protein O0I10_004884 [Lichtheimia ornata]KAJ8659519.1 hypothetical protein O0I10_004884 [Lichtheimia ornata]
MSGITDENKTPTTLSTHSRESTKHITKTSSTQSKASSTVRSPFRDRTLQNVFPETESGRKSPKQAETIVKKKQPTPSPLHKTTATATTTTTKPASPEPSPLQRDVDALVKEKQAKEKELQSARARTSAMRKQLKEMEASIQRAKAELKKLPAMKDDDEEERIKKRLEDLKADMADNREMLQEFEDIIQQGGTNEKEEEEAEIRHLMNAIPEKLLYIQQLKEKL